jgi:sec-independent protein translocase protein TatC
LSDITQEDGPPDDKKMPLLDHLIELRGRLIWAVATFFVCFLITYLFFSGPIFQFLLQPLRAALPEGRGAIFTAPTEAFFTYVKVSAFTAIAVGFPVIAGQIWMFVAPGLYKNERQAFLPFMLATPIMFLLGAALLYYLVLPVALVFFVGFEVPPGTEQMSITLETKISEYLSLIIALILAFGISFELPVLLVLLVRVGILSAQTLSDKRRYAIVAVVAFAGFVTPPDVFSQLSLAVPLYALYEAAILISKWIEKDREKKQREADAALKAKPKPKPKPAAAAAAASPAAATNAGAAAAVATDETDFNLAR